MRFGRGRGRGLGGWLVGSCRGGRIFELGFEGYVAGREERQQILDNSHRILGLRS